MARGFWDFVWFVLNLMWLSLVVAFSIIIFESDKFQILTPVMGPTGLLIIFLLFSGVIASATQSISMISLTTNVIFFISILQGCVILLFWSQLPPQMDALMFIWPVCRVCNMFNILSDMYKVLCLLGYVGYYEKHIFNISGLIFIVGTAHFILSKKLKKLKRNVLMVQV